MGTSSFVYALIMGTCVGAVAGYIGSLMVTKRMALMGGALGHLTMPGISLALLYSFDVSLGAFIFLLLGTLIIWFLRLHTTISTEAITAVVFASSLAIAFLFLPKEKTGQALIGDVSQITPVILMITIIASALIFFVMRKLYGQLILASISSDLARVENINTRKNYFFYLSCIAFVIVLGVRIVGGLMTAALVAIPACTSKNLFKTLHTYAYGSLAFGALACFLGILLYHVFAIPAGPLIIIVSSLFFVLSLCVRFIIVE